MKLNCIDSNTTLGGHRGLFRRLQKNAEQDPTAKHIFIVPDRYTLGVEREICEQCFPNGTFSVDVCSFTRLAVKHLRKTNGLSKEGTVLLLNSVIRRENEKLEYYKDIHSVAFSRQLFAAIASLRSSQITPEKIRAALPFRSDSTTAKMKDIALLYEEYEKALADKYIDTVSRVELLRDTLENIPAIRDSHIYVLGFNVYSALQLSLIEKMTTVCRSVSVSFCKGMGGNNVFCYPSSQRGTLIDYCKENGVPVTYDDCDECLEEPFRSLSKNLFGFYKPTALPLSEEEKEKVRIFAGAQPYEEVKFACREIRHLVFHEGYRYKEIAVMCNDESYLPVLKTMFSRFEIPYFSDEKYLLKDGFFVRYVKALFGVYISGFALQNVLELICHRFSDVGQERAQRFENYCRKYNIGFSRMLVPFTLGEESEITEAEETRKQVVKLVNRVPEDGSKVSEYSDFILSLIETDNVKKLQEQFEGAQNMQEAYSDVDGIKTVAEEMKNLIGYLSCSPSAFLEMFLSSVEGMSVSLLPQKADCVFIGNMQDSRFSDVKTLFVLGAGEGKFPEQKGDAFILSDFDCEVLKAGSLPVYPTPLESNLFEKFSVIDLCTKPDRLYIGYSESNLVGEKTARGEGVNEIALWLGIEQRPLETYYHFDEEERTEYRLGTVENCYYEYMSGKVEPAYRDAVRAFLCGEGKIVEQEKKDEHFNPADGYALVDGFKKMSVTRVERYFSCPYKHFLSDILGLQDVVDGKMEVRDKGIVLHRVLQVFFSENRKDLRSYDEITLEEKITQAIDTAFSAQDFARFRNDVLSRYELEELKKESRQMLCALADNVRNSCFTPTQLEYYIGGKGEITMEAGGEKFRFIGFVDRVDEYDDKVIVIDYKTGGIHADLKDIYCGQKLQLYLYLKYFLDLGKKPAGVFYLPIHAGYSKEGKSYAMQGQLKKDVSLYKEIDNRLPDTGNYVGKTVGFRMENGKFSAKIKKNLLAENDFYNLADYVQKVIQTALADIVAGDVEKNPTENGCDYCPYRRMCGRQVNRREVPAVNPEIFAPIKENENEVE